MKKILMIMAILGLLNATRASAWSYGEFISCDAINPQPQITFRTSNGKLVHDLSTSTARIGELAGASPFASAEKGIFVAGLALAPITSNISFYEASVKKLDDNATCLLPAEIDIFIGYQEPLIYVSNNYHPQSCTFSVLIRHEQVHQRINKLTLEYFLPLLDEAIRNAVLDVRAVKIANDSDAEVKAGFAQLRSYYEARLNPIIEEFIKARDAEQAKLDNMTNYKMEWELCKDFESKHPDKIIKK